MSTAESNAIDSTTQKLTRFQQAQLKSKQTPYNHTASHLLYYTLQQQLSKRIGELVNIDYTHPYKAELTVQYTGDSALTTEQLHAIQTGVNQLIHSNTSLSTYTNNCTSEHTTDAKSLQAFYILKTKRRANKNQYDIAYVVGDGAIELLNKQSNTTTTTDSITTKLNNTAISDKQAVTSHTAVPIFQNWQVCGDNIVTQECNTLIQLTLTELKKHSTNNTIDLSNTDVINKLTAVLSDKYERRINMLQNIVYTNGYVAATANLEVSKTQQLKQF